MDIKSREEGQSQHTIFSFINGSDAVTILGTRFRSETRARPHDRGECNGNEIWFLRGRRNSLTGIPLDHSYYEDFRCEAKRTTDEIENPPTFVPENSAEPKVKFYRPAGAFLTFSLTRYITSSGAVDDRRFPVSLFRGSHESIALSRAFRPQIAIDNSTFSEP